MMMMMMKAVFKFCNSDAHSRTCFEAAWTLMLIMRSQKSRGRLMISYLTRKWIMRWERWKSILSVGEWIKKLSKIKHTILDHKRWVQINTHNSLNHDWCEWFHNYPNIITKHLLDVLEVMLGYNYVNIQICFPYQF